MIFVYKLSKEMVHGLNAAESVLAYTTFLTCIRGTKLLSSAAFFLKCSSAAIGLLRFKCLPSIITEIFTSLGGAINSFCCWIEFMKGTVQLTKDAARFKREHLILVDQM